MQRGVVTPHDLDQFIMYDLHNLLARMDTLGDMLAHASRDERLCAGELFATGTLPGGSGMETGNWLRPGDHLTLTIDGIGEITHTVAQ